MNVASIIVLCVVVALVAVALHFALRKGDSCACGGCPQKDGCPYSGGKCNCGEKDS